VSEKAAQASDESSAQRGVRSGIQPARQATHDEASDHEKARENPSERADSLRLKERAVIFEGDVHQMAAEKSDGNEKQQ